MPARLSLWSSLVRVAALFVFLGCLVGPSRAVEPGEALNDPTLESRARRLSAELRCLVCQNQSIDDSNAPLAKDLRLLVRERISKGESDEQVLSFIVDRYGEFVLLRPPLGAHTILLWLAPLLALVLSVLGFARYIRHQRSPILQSADPAPLDEHEKHRLAEILAAGANDRRGENGS